MINHDKQTNGSQSRVQHVDMKSWSHAQHQIHRNSSWNSGFNAVDALMYCNWPAGHRVMETNTRSACVIAKPWWKAMLKNWSRKCVNIIEQISPTYPKTSQFPY